MLIIAKLTVSALDWHPCPPAPNFFSLMTARCSSGRKCLSELLNPLQNHQIFQTLGNVTAIRNVSKTRNLRVMLDSFLSLITST